MARFDWVKFCERHDIHFVTSGPNTARDRISIRCPFCGNSDPSQHMGLSRDQRNPMWGCLRNARHRGVDPARLIAKLLNIYYVHALALVKQDGPRLDEYDKVMEEFRERNSFEPSRTCKVETRPALALPGEFRLLIEGRYAERFVRYLAQDRGFGEAHAQEIAESYELYYSLSGSYAWRLIFPLRAPGGDLLGWQARDIRYGAKVRYLSSADLPDGPILAFRTQDAAETVLEAESSTIVIVEGPLDALKLDFYGREFGIRAVASMGTGASRQRISALRRIKARRKFLVFDSDAFAQSLAFVEEIPGSRWVPLPEGIKDPGEMNVDQAKKFLTKLTQMS